MIKFTHAIKFSVDLELRTNLLLRCGDAGEFTDSSIEKTPDGQCLHVNGYVWSSLLRRSMGRLEDYKHIAGKIGNYSIPENEGVSPFWFESSFVPLKGTDAFTGNRLDRQYGSAVTGMLFSNEIVPPGLKIPMRFVCFCNKDDAECINSAVSYALWCVDDGIENIGGGWSYGYGRLKVKFIHSKVIDLTDSDERKLLWSKDYNAGYETCTPQKPEPAPLSWHKITVTATVAEGQLLGIHASYPLSDDYGGIKHLPDTFVFKRHKYNDSGRLKSEHVISGKAIRQALLSVPIERKLRTLGKKICSTPGEYCTCPVCADYRNGVRKGNSPDCRCLRCKWFGSTEQGGIIAVTDGVFICDTPTGRAETVILNRIQLCEHSMQNINLFSGEYLKQGIFEFDVFIDRALDPTLDRDSGSELLEGEVRCILNEAKGINCPPGWYRIGATSTATGQVRVIDFEER